MNYDKIMEYLTVYIVGLFAFLITGIIAAVIFAMFMECSK